MRPAGVLGVATAAALVGVLVGHYGWPAPSRAAAPEAGTATRRLVCTNVAEPAEDAPDCGELTSRLQWCEGRLASAARQKPTGRKEWPETRPEDAPDEWMERINRLIETCHLPVTMEVADCDEYPCVGALRPARPGLTRKELVRAQEACPEAEEILGPLEFDAVEAPVTCPDGSTESALVVFATTNLDEANPAVKALFPTHEPELADIIVFGGRRAESALQTWQCAGVAPP